MLRWRETKTHLRRSAWLGVAWGLGFGVACSGNSSRHRNDAGGSAARSGAGADAGTSSSAGRSGAAGARGGGVGAGAGGAGSGGDAAAGTSGATTSGSAGVAMALGGASGSGAGMPASGGAPLGGGGNGATSGTESSAGAEPGGAGPCIDFCKQDTPACCTEELRCMPGVPMCRIDVLADFILAEATYADLVAKIATLSDDIAVSIGDAEIATAAMDPFAASRIELDLTAQASATHGPALKNLMNHAFRVSCDGTELYVGIIYLREGAAALRTPVLHVEDAEDGTIRLLLGAQEGEWAGFVGFADEEYRERLDRPELRAALCERGILSELGPPPP